LLRVLESLATQPEYEFNVRFRYAQLHTTIVGVVRGNEIDFSFRVFV
jgi:hypothetical protein